MGYGNDCRISPTFELVSKYEGHDELLPSRATDKSAGYDFYVAEDTVIPAQNEHAMILAQQCFRPEDFAKILFKDEDYTKPFSLNEVAALTKQFNAKPTLVPTGVKVYLPKQKYLQLSVRSSCPLKYWLILANGVGIIDADYYNNPDNEGHIFFQIINLFPRDIILHKGDKIGQGIILPYDLAGDLYEKEHGPAAARAGGFGSTGS